LAYLGRSDNDREIRTGQNTGVIKAVGMGHYGPEGSDHTEHGAQNRFSRDFPPGPLCAKRVVLHGA
jgi:hypothetical protein